MEFIQEIPSKLLALLNSIPSDSWGIVAEVVVAAVTTSSLMVGVKKWLQVNGDKLMLTLTIFGSLLAGTAAYLHSDPTFGPWFALVQGWLIFATTQPVYRFFVKGVCRRLGNWFAEQVAKATALSEAKAAAVPPGGLPLAVSPSGTDDFSH